jgi:hypothetical protein
VIDEGVAAGAFACADPKSTVTRIGALLDGLSVAALVYKSINREQLRAWVRDATADELGVERSLLSDQPVHRLARRGERVPVEREG